MPLFFFRRFSIYSAASDLHISIYGWLENSEVKLKNGRLSPLLLDVLGPWGAT
jgi:hypothetical protein